MPLCGTERSTKHAWDLAQPHSLFVELYARCCPATGRQPMTLPRSHGNDLPKYSLNNIKSELLVGFPCAVLWPSYSSDPAIRPALMTSAPSALLPGKVLEAGDGVHQPLTVFDQVVCSCCHDCVGVVVAVDAMSNRSTAERGGDIYWTKKEVKKAYRSLP